MFFNKNSSVSFSVLSFSQFHLGRFTLAYPPNMSVFLPRPLTPLHSPVLARPRPFLSRSSPVLARPSPTLVSSNLPVKTVKREIYYFPFLSFLSFFSKRQHLRPQTHHLSEQAGTSAPKPAHQRIRNIKRVHIWRLQALGELLNSEDSRILMNPVLAAMAQASPFLEPILLQGQNDFQSFKKSLHLNSKTIKYVTVITGCA